VHWGSGGFESRGRWSRGRGLAAAAVPQDAGKGWVGLLYTWEQLAQHLTRPVCKVALDSAVELLSCFGVHVCIVLLCCCRCGIAVGVSSTHSTSYSSPALVSIRGLCAAGLLLILSGIFVLHWNPCSLVRQLMQPPCRLRWLSQPSTDHCGSCSAHGRLSPLPAAA
jgi:hypothetical protein